MRFDSSVLLQLPVNNHLKKVHAMATLNAGTLTKNKTHASHSDTADAKEPKTTLPAKKLVNINAKIQQFKNVSLLCNFIDYIWPTDAIITIYLFFLP